VTQEVFVTVFKAIDSFRGESKFSTWLYRIASNHCKNRMKYLGRRAHKKTGELDEGAEQEIGGSGSPSAMAPEVVRPDAMLEGLQLERILQEGIASLDEDHREVLVLCDVEDLTYEDISSITGLPDGTVKSRLHRARIQLKEFISRRMK
jgi:RNA polymerase sigma-70 factor (ECF subfamily)